MYTKLRNWDLKTDGPYPASSKRFQNFLAVLIQGPKGNYFGYENEQGVLYPLSVVSFNAEASAERDDRNEAFVDKQAALTNYEATYATLRAKREREEPLTMDDLNVLADLFFKIGLQ